MNANNTNRNNTNDESQPRNINPGEINARHPAKIDRATENPVVNKDIAHHDDTETPFNDHIEGDISQIDKGTIELQEKKKEAADHKHEVGERDVMATEARKPNEINSTDNRDHNDSTTDWNAEHNETGRHK